MLSGGDRGLINRFQRLLSTCNSFFMDFCRFPRCHQTAYVFALGYALCKPKSLTKSASITSTVFLLVFVTFKTAENSFMYRMIEHIITLIRVYLNLRVAQPFS